MSSTAASFGSHYRTIIDQRDEDAMSSPTIYRTILWTLMTGSLVAGALAFVVYQLTFVIFNR